MASTKRIPFVGAFPSCGYSSRLEMKAKRRIKKSERKEDLIVYDHADDEPINAKFTFLCTSRNLADYVNTRQFGFKNCQKMEYDYANRHILTHEMLKEHPLDVGRDNKIFSCQWLNHHQIVFGSKCNKIKVYDLKTKTLDVIPTIHYTVPPDDEVPESTGIHAMAMNGSKCFLATGGYYANSLAIYKLPTLDPIYVGEGGHEQRIFDATWIQDDVVASCSRDDKVTIWRIPEAPNVEVWGPYHKPISPIVSSNNANSIALRASVYNTNTDELAIISLNGYVHLWDVQLFKQTHSSRLPSCNENVCLSWSQNRKLYAVGCRTYTALLDERTLSCVHKIHSRVPGVRSLSFFGDICTIGTGSGMVFFYDLRNNKNLDSSITSSRMVSLKTSRGYLNPEEEADLANFCPRYLPAIYTHAYDASGTKLFCAGGPLQVGNTGNYAAIWQ